MKLTIMAVKYILFDIDNSKTKVWKKHLHNIPIDVICSSVTEIKADIYVSPANGYGQLDGGIDKIYRTMFPGIQNTVNEHLKSYKERKPPVGVGSALLIKIPERNSQLLLAPTMELPGKLKTSWNCFWAALAIFYLTKDFNGTVAIPGLGTGTGHIEAKEMIDMFVLAYKISQKLEIDKVYNIPYEYNKSSLILSQSLNEQAIPVILQNIIKSLY